MTGSTLRAGPGPGTTPPAATWAPGPAAGRPVSVARSDQVVLVPVTRGGDRPRPVGVYVVTDGGVRFRPVLDLDRLLTVALLTAGAVAATASVAATVRRGPAIDRVTMGPGGWVSVKGAPTPALRAGGRDGRRPWWARLLGARRLVVEP